MSAFCKSKNRAIAARSRGMAARKSGRYKVPIGNCFCFACIKITISADMIIVAVGIGYAKYEQTRKNMKRDFKLRIENIHMKKTIGLSVISNRNQSLISAKKLVDRAK